MGIELDKHGKLPDLIVYLKDRDWLVLIEAANSRGSVIAWETEAWCADAPTHLIHFNGERFLGPCDGEQ